MGLGVFTSPHVWVALMWLVHGLAFTGTHEDWGSTESSLNREDAEAQDGVGTWPGPRAGE